MPVSCNTYQGIQLYIFTLFNFYFAGSSSESDRIDGSARYDPADMVVDMDMSDEDLDESQRGNKHLRCFAKFLALVDNSILLITSM